MSKSRYPCPGWLSKEAKTEWRRVLKEIEQNENIRQVDLKVLESYCQSYSRWRECEKLLEENGFTFETDKGYIQQRPEVSISNKALENMRAFAKELGFTPASRSRMNKNAPRGDPSDPELEEMIAK